MDQLIQTLQSVVGLNAVLTEPDELLVYECDGLPQHKYLPRAVVFPDSTEAVAEVMRTLHLFKVPFTPRGAGTGLSGGALALDRGVVIELARMRNILKIDTHERIAIVQTGVVNLHVSRAVAHLGLHYVPDPSSQPTCTIGGNIAENAGGIHCLKYGTTTDHVLAARVVLSDGEIVELRSGETGFPGYDLLGVFIGSEGTFGIATEATLRLTPVPETVRTLLGEFSDVDDASRAVSAIIAAGVMPAALEMMDREIIRAIEASVFAAGLPPEAGAALLIELDGLEAGIDDEAEKVQGICLQYGARSCRLARDEAERKRLWAARKGAFGAIGRIAPDSMIQDAVVPRSRLPEIMQQSYRIAAKYQLVLANVFHAGDGNLHPLICFDSRSADEVRRVREAGRELMETCVRAGGSITGEHGVGLDKRDYLPLIFSEDDMDAMLRVRAAFDPAGLCNPGKIVPMLRGCGEAGTSPVKVEAIDQNVFTQMSNVDIKRNHQAQTIHSLSSRLVAIVGPSNAEHETGQISPGSIAETSQVMKIAADANCAVVPTGAQSWLDAGNQLSKVDLKVDLRRMNRILEHEPADLIATAEAGVRLTDLNRELAAKGQWLPLDPPDDGTATLGGIVATGLAGPQKLGYGPPRRFVIGMKLVLADGRIIKAGGKVVKNVAGYDLCKLFTGSYGTLGVICELTFKLRPQPALITSLVVHGQIDSLLATASAIHATSLAPVAMEVLSANFAEKVLSVSENSLLLRFAGSRKTVAFQIEQSVGIADRRGTRVIERDEEVWRRFSAMTYRSPSAVISRIIIPTSAMPDFLGNFQGHAPWHAGLGTGIIRTFDNEFVEARIKELRKKAERLGGFLVIEKVPAQLKPQVDCWGDLNLVKPLMTRLKKQLDPANVLSPGRF